MKTRILLGCILLAAVSAAQDPETADSSDRIAELLGTGSDPFRFGYQGAGLSASDQNLIPIDASQLAIGLVKVKGILSIDGQAPCALVQVGRNEQMQLVRENDLVLISGDSRGYLGIQKKTSESKYLLVSKILKDSILVAPKKSPETLITIR